MPDHERKQETVPTNAERMQQALLAARQRRADYRIAIEELAVSSVFLKGTRISITGVIHGRGGTRVYPDNPLAHVEDLAVDVWQASIVDYEYAEGVPPDCIPFVSIVARTAEGNELVCANLIDTGVFAQTIETQPLNAQAVRQPL